MLLRSNFFSFPQYFQNVSNLGVRLHVHSVKGGCSINCFPESANLICRSTDISNCFIESLGVRDNENRLYFHNYEYYPLPNNVKQTNMFVVLIMFQLFLCLLLVLHGEQHLHLYTIHAYQSYEKKDLSVCCKLFRCLTDCIT